MRRCLRIVGLLLCACGPGHAPENMGTSSGGSTGSTATIPTTGGPVVTGLSGTTDTTAPGEASDTATTGMTSSPEGSETSTTDADPTGTSTTGVEPCEDTMGGADAGTEALPAWVPYCMDPQIQWYYDHVDCRIDCSTMTEIRGRGAAARLPVITQVAFGVAHSPCGGAVGLLRLSLGGLTKPQVQIFPYLQCALDPWLGEHVIEGTLPDDTTIEAIMTIDSYAGDWVSVDPIDPPRLFGSFAGDLVGPFEAIHCSALDTNTYCE